MDHAELELDLHRFGHEPSEFKLVLRFSLPDSDWVRSADQSITLNLSDLGPLAQDLTAYGRLLTGALFSSQSIRDRFIKALGLAQWHQPPLPLRLRMQLDPSDSALQAVRWETLVNPEDTDDFLAIDENILVSRLMRVWDNKELPPPRQEGVRVLVVIANPSSPEEMHFSPVNVTAELANARLCLSGLPLTILASPPAPEPDCVGAPTIGNLIHHLRQGYDILYLVCHGRIFNDQAQILLEDEHGDKHLISDVDLPGPTLGLVRQLSNLPNLPRLVVLASCQSAGAGGEWISADDGALAALGPRLALAGIPVVLGMQGNIRQKTAALFLKVFFNELRQNGMVDRAAAAARATLVQEKYRDWWAPVLYMRLDSGLVSLGEKPAAPFMAGEMKGYVPRPFLMDQAVAALTRPNPPSSLALHGFGGFGKTTLARAICHHPDVRQAFPDGILWVTAGEDPRLQDVIVSLNHTLSGDWRSFANLEDARNELVRQLDGKRCLLVVDDVWNSTHLEPFLVGGAQCVRLVTTRSAEIAAHLQERILVDEMTPDEAIDLLIRDLTPPPVDRVPFDLLAGRMGYWPLMLDLAGAALRRRTDRGGSLEGALQFINQGLDQEGLTAFDRQNAEQRDQAVSKTIDASLRLLTPDETERLRQLAIFPLDIDIPLPEIQRLWDLTTFSTERACENFADLSLCSLDLRRGVLHLHDVMRAYLKQKLVDEASLHLRLVDSWGDPLALPSNYAWGWIVYHLAEAVQLSQASFQRLDLARRLVNMIMDPAFQNGYLAALNDPAALHADLKRTLRTTASVGLVDALPLILSAANGLGVFRRQKLTPQVIFEFARQGNVEAAVRQLGCFSPENEWRQAILLLIAWQAAAANPAKEQVHQQALDLFERLQADLPGDGPLQRLSTIVDRALHQQPWQAAHFSGYSREMLDDVLVRMAGLRSHLGQPVEGMNEGFFEGRPGEGSYVASMNMTSMDSKILVAYVADHPSEEPDYVEQYLGLIGANSYVRYRNRFLWPLLDAVLDHPDPAWSLKHAVRIGEVALAANKLEFEEGVPLLLLALQAQFDLPLARQHLDEHRREVSGLARKLVDEYSSGDSWGSFTRRLSALALAYHLLGEPQIVSELLVLAFQLHFGKAGLMVPARLSQAETARICGLSIAPILDQARDSAHNIQDPTFCALTTARYNAMRTRWWDPVLGDPQGKPLPDLDETVDQLLKQPHSPAFSSLHDPQETYSRRGSHGFNTDLPHWARHPGSFEELAQLYGCQLEELQMLNPQAAGDDPINLPDHEMAAWIAARLAAEVLVACLPQNKDPLQPLMKLVPPVEYYPTCLDAVLARLLLGTAPHIDSNLLEQMVEVTGDPYSLLMKKLGDDLQSMGNVNEFVG